MLGKLALQRTNWAALAVLAALAVALFAVLQSASAQTAPAITSSTDSDFVIGDGGSITVTVEGTGVTATDWAFQPIFGFVLTNPNGTTYTSGNAKYTHQAGAPMGEFKIRATHASLSPVTKSLEVGDPGTNLAVVNVKLGTVNVATDGTRTRYSATDTAHTATPEKDTAEVGNNILIEVEALNSLGAKSNAVAIGSLSVTIFAVNGLVADGDDAASGSASDKAESTVAQQNVLPFAVTRTTTEGPGDVRVFAVVTIGKETVTSDDLNLTFTAVAGAPTVVSLESGGVVAQHGASLGFGDGDTGILENTTPIDPPQAATRAILPVSATDAEGIDATLAADTAISATVKGPDDKNVTDNGITNVAVVRYVLDTDTTTTTVNESGIVVTLPADTAPGEYTVEATLGTSKSEATFTVTGPPTTVEVSISAEDGTDLGAQLTATATVTDTNGNLVAPVDVVFTVGTGSPATFVGVDSKTKDGVASRTAVVTGAGVITVIATSAGVSGVDVIVAGAVDPEPIEPEEVSLGCLNPANVNSFSTYDCGIEATASELFDLVASRGASAIHLWNGSSWVRYSVVEGQTVPGSSDFVVEDGNILYISG